MFHLGQGGPDFQHAGKHRRIFGNEQDTVAVRNDERNFLRRRVGRARNVCRATKKHRGVAKHPLRAIVRQNRDMLAGLQSEFDKSRGQSDGIGVKLPIGPELEVPRPFAVTLRGAIRVNLGRQLIEIGYVACSIVDPPVFLL